LGPTSCCEEEREEEEEEEEGLEQDFCQGDGKVIYVSDVVQEYCWCGNLCDLT
jgi:hypothetical protein